MVVILLSCKSSSRRCDGGNSTYNIAWAY